MHRDRPFAHALLLPLISLLSAATVLITLRRGVPMSPDGWLYWQAASSLLDGKGYVDAFGRSLVHWPPGWPSWLAGWQAFFGSSGQALAIAIAGTVFFASLGFGLLFTHLAKRYDHGTKPALLAHAMAAVLLAGAARSAHSELLLYVLLPHLLLVVLELHRSDRLARAWLWIVAGALLLCAMIWVRHIAIAFAPGLALLAWLRLGALAQPALRPKRILAASIPLGLPAAFLFMTRHWLGQEGSYPMGPGVSRFGPGEYLLQLLRGLDANAGVEVAGGIAMLLAILLLVRDRQGMGRPVLLLVAVALVALFAIFNVTYVFDPLRGRFTFFANLCLVPLALLSAGEIPDTKLRRLVIGSLVLLGLVAPFVKHQRHTIAGRGPETPLYHEESLRRFLPRNAHLRYQDAYESWLSPDGLRLVQPPRFDQPR